MFLQLRQLVRLPERTVHLQVGMYVYSSDTRRVLGIIDWQQLTSSEQGAPLRSDCSGTGALSFGMRDEFL